jgi:hypothetical protein
LDVHRGYASLKPLPEKIMWVKILMKEKEYSLKTLPGKLNGIKPW